MRSIEILEPSGGSTFFAGEQIRLRARTADVHDPDFPVGQVWWTSDRAGRIGTGHEIAARLAQGTHVVCAHFTRGVSEATDEVLIVIAAPALDLPPVVTILEPASDARVHYQGFDAERRLSYADVTLVGRAVDPEDGDLARRRPWGMGWTTDRREFHALRAFHLPNLGGGARLTVRLYGADRVSERHEITFTASDSAGNRRSATRIIVLQDVCS
jgi:hypothetical protein